MNIETFKEWFEAAGGALTTIKALKDLLPAGPKRDEAERLIRDAESALKRSDAKLAEDLGFKICSRCWPPEIMLVGDGNVWRCRSCGKEPPTPHFPKLDPPGPPKMRWH